MPPHLMLLYLPAMLQVTRDTDTSEGVEGRQLSLGRLQDSVMRLLRELNEDGRPVFALWDEAQR